MFITCVLMLLACFDDLRGLVVAWVWLVVFVRGFWLLLIVRVLVDRLQCLFVYYLLVFDCGGLASCSVCMMLPAWVFSYGLRCLVFVAHWLISAWWLLICLLLFWGLVLSCGLFCVVCWCFASCFAFEFT